MKTSYKLFSSLVIFLSLNVCYTYAQVEPPLWLYNPNGDHIYNQNTGNTGIGIANPLLPLHIKAPGLQIGSVDADFSYHLITNTVSGVAALRLYSGNYGSGVHLATFGTDGKLGIGEPSPGYKLDVRGDINTSNGFFINSSALPSAGDYNFRFQATSSADWGIEYYANLKAYSQGMGLRIRDDADNFFFIRATNSGVKRLAIKQGKIGIGTENPAEKLHVAGNLKVDADLKLGGNVVGNLNVNGMISNVSTVFTTSMRFKSIGDDNWGIEHSTDPTNNPAALFGLGIRINESIGGFYIVDKNSNQKRFVIKSGNVGIGTENPDVNYKLSVNGKIRAKEVKVETGWSDFVFDENYKLWTLEEVEAYIKENKHLPDIPSEKEVSENGIELGNMIAKVTQKLEEQMLYIIELKKEIQKMKEKIDILEHSK